MEWYEPVDIWNMFGINSKKEFVASYVIEGKFHKNVPEDISKSFVTVSYLLAHSYYHLPMFDEALSKALLIMEMAVKLKAEELGIDLKNKPNKKGERWNKNLSGLIDELCLEKSLEFLKSDFNRAREIRNHKMHPSRHSFAGTMSYASPNSRLFVNILNLLFLDYDGLNKMQKKINDLELSLLPFKNGLFVLEFNNQRILIDGFHTFKFREFEDKSILLLYINTLTTKVHEQFVEKKYQEPLIIEFSEFIIEENYIEGLDLEGHSLKIYVDDSEANLKTYFQYNEALSEVSESDLNMFINFNSQRALWKMEKIICENLWVIGKEN